VRGEGHVDAVDASASKRPDDWPKSDRRLHGCAWRWRHAAELDQSQMADAMRGQDHIGGKVQRPDDWPKLDFDFKVRGDGAT
jgi:hypothetical protein